MRYSLNQRWQLMRRAIAGVAFALLLFPQWLMAAETARPMGEAVSASQIINLLAGLVVVLLVFFVIVFLLKRLSGLNGMNKGHMKIVDAMHLGTKERLLIVKVTDKHILLGISPQGIHPLHVLGDDIVEDTNQDSVEAQAGFSQLLAKMKGA
jgi:flagellar protein FliO/FliZ